jgi:CheY-like chemotaxis protein
VARLREFYRAREIDQQFTELNLNALVQQVIDLTRARWSDIPQEQGIVIELRTRLQEPLPSILGAETEIRDGLTNLVFNAIDAMPGGGTLSLVTSARSATIALDVIDTGVGMDDETQRRCIEPFFTTKGQRGTGLGLATVYGMVQRHGGSLEIESAPGKGACVRLVFPMQNTTPDSSSLRQLDVSTARSLKVLVVDDEVQILASLRTVFEGDGHRVDVCDGGQAGIDAFRNALTQGEPYDIVFTDLGMPRVDGRAVSAAIRRMSPELPIVLLTGWGQRLLDQEQSPEHVSLVLAKPPNLDSLRRALVTLTKPPAGIPVRSSEEGHP